MNDIPITTVTSDPNDLEPQTPNHLLLLKTNPIIPPGLLHKGDTYSRKIWRKVQYMTDFFWKRLTRGDIPLVHESTRLGGTEEQMEAELTTTQQTSSPNPADILPSCLRSTSGMWYTCKGGDLIALK